MLNEFKLERVRQKVASDAVSRLSGLYFFRSKDEALHALDHRRWWDRAAALSRVLFWPTTTTEVDSEWITQHLLGDDDSSMPRYWSGEPR